MSNVTNPLGAFIYAYVDQTSRLQTVTYPVGAGETGLSLDTTYSYFDNAGDQRLQEIKNLKGTTPLSDFQYTYNPLGTIATWQLQADSSTPTAYTFGYDAADQVASAVQKNTSTLATVSSNGYNYDPAGNRLLETTLTAKKAGKFNALNQLTGFTASATTRTVAGYASAAVSSVTVDAVPATISNSTNFTASVPVPNGTNVMSVVAQPSAAGGSLAPQRYQFVTNGAAPTALHYDANGNCTQDESGNLYTWDASSRLTKITYPSTAYTTMAYDGLSRRIQIAEYNSVHSLTSTKNYVWIGSEIAEERNIDNTQVTKRFFPQGEQQSGANYYYTRDHLGSVRELCSSSGSIVARYSYDPYGRTTLVSGTNLATFQYTGDYVHQTSGLNLTKYRAYDPNTARWLSRDPIGTAGGINLYEYVGDEPTDFYDLLGLEPPSSPRCKKLAASIEAKQGILKGKYRELANDRRNLPQSAPGDDIKPSLSINGHLAEIAKLENKLAADQALYASTCSDPEPPSGGTCPVNVPVPQVSPATKTVIIGGTVVVIGCVICPECCIVVAPVLL